MPEPKVCSKHGETLVKIGKDWYCKSCLHAAHLTNEAQKEAQRRWRQSSRGKQKVREWATGPGKETRERYLKGPKGMAKRLELRKKYNEQLKEAQAISRAGGHDRGTTFTSEQLSQKLAALARDIWDTGSWRQKPTVDEVIKNAATYGLELTHDQAQKLIDETLKRGS